MEDNPLRARGLAFSFGKHGGFMKLTGKEKVTYGLGPVGKDMVYMFSASYD